MVNKTMAFLGLALVLRLAGGDYLSFDDFIFDSPNLQGKITHRSDSGEIISSSLKVYIYLYPFEILESFQGYLTLQNGAANFVIEIWCEDTYNLFAYARDSIEGVSPSFTRTNGDCYPISSNIDPGENGVVLVNQDFRIYGNFNHCNNCNFYFEEIFGGEISGEVSSTLDGYNFDNTLQITFKGQRTVMIIINNYYSKILFSEDVRDYLTFEFVDKKPKKVNESFSVKATVLRELVTSEYELQIIVFIDAPTRRLDDTSSYLSGTLVQTTVNGEILFSGLKFLTHNDYGFYINNEDLNLQDTEYLTILKEFGVNLIKISAPCETLKLGETLAVTTYLYQDNVIFERSNEVNIITDLAFEGDDSITTSTGIADFTVSFTSIGKAIITATTIEDYPDVVVESFTIYSTDPLCLALDNDKNCIECIYLAEFVDGICTCLNHYHYENFDCVKDDGVSLIIMSVSEKHLKIGETLTVTIFLYNENILYEKETEVTLFSSNLVMSGENSVTSSTGIFEFEIEFTGLGVTLLTAKSAKDYDDFEVSSFEIFSVDPLCSSLDNDGACLECIYLADFNEELCECIENTYYDEPDCIYDDGVDFLSVMATTKILKLGKSLIVTVSLSLNSIAYINEAEVSLIVTGLEFIGENKVTTSNGIAEFEIIFTSLGVALISAESSTDFINVAVETFAVYSVDPLCLSFDDDNNCLECTYLAEFSKSTCECIENAYYAEPNCVYENGVNLIILTASKEKLPLGKTLTISVFITLDNVFYTEETEVTLLSSGLEFEGENKVTTSTGLAEFYISFTSLGLAKLEAESTKDFTNVKVESFTVISVDPLCLVFDENYDCVECIYLADFVEGMCSCIDNSYYEEPKCVRDDGIDLIVLSGSHEIIEYGQTLTVFVLLFENYLMYQDELEVTLNSNIEFDGNNKVITDTGIAEFYISFTGLGKATLTAKSSRDFDDVEVTTFDVYSTDPLCSVLDSEEKCLKCINLSDFAEGFCTCNENSYYNEPNCLCKDGYFDDLLNNCQKCSNQFSDQDIVSYYNQNYNEITVEFIENIMNSTESCYKFVSLPSSYVSLYSQCNWLNSKTFVLGFSEQLPAVNIEIIIDSSLTPMKTLCNFYQQEIKIIVEMIYDLPYPSIELVSPSLCSIPCLEEDPVVKHIITNTYYEYSWSASSSSQNLIDYIEGQNLPVLTLSKNLMVAEDLYIYATVKNVFYGTESSKSILIKVKNEYFFTVGFDYGSQIVVKSSTPLYIKAQILSSCNVVGIFTYSWKYYSDSLLDLDSILQNSPRPDTIYLPANTLDGNNNYIIEANITSSETGVYGSGQIFIDVMLDEIKLKLNRWGGTIGSEIDLEIIATVENSENMDLLIDYEWSCKEGSEECIGNNGNALYSSTSGNKLTITKDQLRDGAIYLFKVVASTVQTNAVQQVEFLIDNNAKGEIIIETNELVIDNSKNYKLISEIIPLSESTFFWDFEPDLNSNSYIDYTNSFIIIPPNSLQIGTTHKVTLIMSPESASDIIAYTYISRSYPPACSTFKSERLNNKYYLEGLACTSPQNIIYYQFGYTVERQYWVTNPSPLSYASIFIDDNAENILMNVCDEYECTLYENPAENSKQRRDLAIIDDFFESIKNYDDIPNAAIYYVKKADSIDTYNTIVFTMGDYFYSEIISPTSSSLYISCLYSAFEKPTYVSPEIVNYLKNLTVYIISKYSETSSNSEVESIIDSFNPYISMLDYENLHELLSAVKKIWFKGKLPGESILNIEGKLGVYANRLFSSDLPSLELNFSHSTISIPTDLEMDNELIIDIFYAKYFLNDDFFELSFYESGTFIDYSLVITESKETQLLSESKVQVEINGTYNLDMNHECQFYNITSGWENSGCDIVKVTETKITASLDHLSSFRVNEFSKTCTIGRGPVIAMGVLIIFCLILAGVFTVKDLRTKDFPKLNLFVLNYPYSSMFYHQPYFRRTILILQTLGNFLVLFCLIGVLEVYFNSPEEKTTDNYGDYFESSIYSGATAWGITQGFIIPFFLYNCVIDKSRVGLAIQGIVWAICTAASIVGIIYMTAVYCNEFTFYWIINILIFTPIQIVLDTLYALAVRFIICKSNHESDISDKTGKSRKKKENNIFTEPDRQEEEDNKL